MDLQEEVAYELAHPRQSVRAAIDALGLAPGMTVLDVGCGAGAHLGLFADAVSPGGVVIGLDRDPARLALANTFHPARVASGAIRLIEGDLHALPADLGPIDCVWASLVLHHEPEPVPVLRGFSRAVRPGGRVAILDGDGGGSFPVMPLPLGLELRLREAAWRAEQARYGGALPYHFAGYLGRQLPRLLREGGLHAVRMDAFADTERAPLHPTKARSVREWLRASFGARLRPFLAPHDWNQFLALVTEGEAGDLVADPDFVFARTWYLAVGTVSAV